MEIKIRACDRCPIPKEGEVPAKTTTQVFSHDGRRVAIDLCGTHTPDFLDLWDRLDEYMEHARAARSSVPSTVGAAVERRDKRLRGERQPRRDNDRIRTWAQKNGFEVSNRGRIPEEIVKAYDEAAYGVDLGKPEREEQPA